MSETVFSQLVVSILILAFLWFRVFPSLRRDNFRSDIRKLRDSLFDYMWENGHAFDNMAYCETRLILNGILRMSNSITAIKFFALVVLHRNDSRAVEDPLEQMADCDLKRQIETVRAQAVARLLHFLFLEGTTGLVVRMMLSTSHCIKRVNNIKPWIRRQGSQLLTDFRSFGEPNLPSPTRSILQA